MQPNVISFHKIFQISDGSAHKLKSSIKKGDGNMPRERKNEHAKSAKGRFCLCVTRWESGQERHTLRETHTSDTSKLGVRSCSEVV